MDHGGREEQSMLYVLSISRRMAHVSCQEYDSIP